MNRPHCIVEYREDMQTSETETRRSSRQQTIEYYNNELEVESENFFNANPTAVMGPMADVMEEHHARGRPSQAEVTERARGKEVRDELCDALHMAGLGRPLRARISVADRFNQQVAVEQ